jgi:hypothetical protein
MNETTSLLENQKPTEKLRELEILIDQLWSDQHDRDVFAHISSRLKDIEGAVTRKYASFPPKEQRRYKAGDFAETLEIVRELSGWQWLWRCVCVCSLSLQIAIVHTISSPNVIFCLSEFHSKTSKREKLQRSRSTTNSQLY